MVVGGDDRDRMAGQVHALQRSEGLVTILVD
jgi:hypothetical protein